MDLGMFCIAVTYLDLLSQLCMQGEGRASQKVPTAEKGPLLG